ncbi:MAG TPA: hypothetical protein VK621_25685, partial [Bradyrhizobium sp.]|nr:hypothetical protein [Bradyrhizobium sp.]
MRVATTRLARVIARLRVLRAIVRIRAPPVRIEFLPPDAFPSSGSEEDNEMAARIGTARGTLRPESLMPHCGGCLDDTTLFFSIEVFLDNLRMIPTTTKASGSRSNGTERLTRLIPSCVAIKRGAPPPKTMTAKTRLAGGETGK